MENSNNSLIVLSGPSGAGKTELINYIVLNDSTFIEATGATTRKRRENEEGKMYFLTREEFQKLILSDDLIEYCEYNGNFYGVSKKEFAKLQTHNVIFNVSYSSARVIKGLKEDAFMIYLLPPNKEELLRRLEGRDIERYRLGIEETMNYALCYEYLLLSYTDNLDKSYEEFMDIVNERETSNQRKLVLAKNRDFVRNFYR